jgi:hypothetical protein
MPDYDPKSIPILDDIIEDDATEPELTGSVFADVENEDSDETAINSLDLFVDDTVDIEQEAMEPSLGTIDRFINPADDELTAIETDTAESALIDYQHDQDEPGISIQHDTQALESPPGPDETSDDITIDDTTASDPNQPVTLNAIVDDVVKQLMPDLERQLRFLVQQALEEKLPEEIARQLTNEKID